MYIVEKDTQITPEIVKAAIKSNETQRLRYDTLNNYYLGEHPIKNRSKNDMLKNNKLVINHPKYIVDVNVGYLLGNPVDYQSTKKADLTPITDQYKMQTISDLDHEIAKAVSTMGKAYDYTYAVENENVLHTKMIDARNCITIYDDTLEHTMIAAVIYTCIKKDGEDDEYTNITALTKENIIKFDSKFVQTDISEHSFGVVPVTEYRNNSEEKGDFEPVISLVDAYNIFQSDRINDKEQLVEAILILYGFTLTPDQMKQLKDNRVLSGLPLKNAGAAAEYLTKDLNEADIDTLRQVLEADIHKISMTPNLSDKEFVGNSSGVAIKYKLIAFEQNILNKERYFEKGLLHRFSIYNNYLNKLNNTKLFPTHEIDAVFKRNLPKNDLETSTVITNLRGIVPDQTLISELSFIKDAAKEVEDAQAESLQRMKDTASNFAISTPNGEPTVDPKTGKKVSKVTDKSKTKTK